MKFLLELFCHEDEKCAMEIFDLFVIDLSPGNFSLIGSLSVPIFLFAIVTFLLRLNGENIFRNSSAVTRVNHCTETPVIQIENPYCIKLKANGRDSGEVQLEFTFLQPCMVSLLWNVNISKFYEHLKSSWCTLIQEIRDGSMITERKLALMHSECEKFDICQNLCKSYAIPDAVKDDDLGTPPRQKYPLVVVTMIPEETSEPDQDSPCVVMMFTIIHLKDDRCQLASHVICQYIKTSDGNMSCLQPLYVSTADSPTDSVPKQPTQQNLGAVSSSNSDTSVPKNQDDSMKNSTPGDHMTNAISSSTLCSGACGEVSKRTERTRNSVPSSMDGTENGQMTTTVSEDDEECVVCQNSSVTTALLPCRHACVCDFCLNKIDKCPMCRAMFVSYFKLRHGDLNINHDENVVEQQIPNNENQNWWQNLNERLNNYLGFT